MSAEADPSQPVPEGTVTDPAYHIGPGDSLQIYVARNPELSITVPVRLDGKITTPLVEDMVAVGKTPSSLARDMEGVLAEFVRSPQVNVMVMHADAAFSQVKATGQVKNPQSLAYRQGMTVFDLVLAVGGLTDFAAAKRAKIVRVEAGKQKDIPVNLKKLLDGGDLDQNIILRPGDILVVPETYF